MSSLMSSLIDRRMSTHYAPQGHGRAGDALCAQETLTLVLDLDQMEAFGRLGPPPGSKRGGSAAATVPVGKLVSPHHMLDSLTTCSTLSSVRTPLMGFVPMDARSAGVHGTCQIRSGELHSQEPVRHRGPEPTGRTPLRCGAPIPHSEAHESVMR